jgi:hypothetical protein
VATLRNDQQHAVGKVEAERSRLEARLTGIRNRMDGAYTDKLDGKISEEFWERKMADWRMEEQQIKMAIQGLSDAATETRKAKLLRMRFSNCSVDAVSVMPMYRKPFDMIFEKGSFGE